MSAGGRRRKKLTKKASQRGVCTQREYLECLDLGIRGQPVVAIAPNQSRLTQECKHDLNASEVRALLQYLLQQRYEMARRVCCAGRLSGRRAGWLLRLLAGWLAGATAGSGSSSSSCTDSGRRRQARARRELVGGLRLTVLVQRLLQATTSGPLPTPLPTPAMRSAQTDCFSTFEPCFAIS